MYDKFCVISDVLSKFPLNHQATKILQNAAKKGNQIFKVENRNFFI